MSTLFRCSFTLLSQKLVGEDSITFVRMYNITFLAYLKCHYTHTCIFFTAHNLIDSIYCQAPTLVSKARVASFKAETRLLYVTFGSYRCCVAPSSSNIRLFCNIGFWPENKFTYRDNSNKFKTSIINDLQNVNKLAFALLKGGGWTVCVS
jgi:hypothetical protein